MKKIIGVLLVVIFAVFLTGCGNRQLFDTTYTFDYATIYSPSGEVVAQGKVQSWNDYDNCDQLQVKIDGIVYLTHASNVVLEDR